MDQRFYNTIDLPPAVLENWPRLTLWGTGEVELEGYGALLYFGRERVTVGWMKGRLTVEGSGLCIREMSRGSLILSGNITGIRWEGGHGME